MLLPGYEVIEQPFDVEEYAYAKRPELSELSVEERVHSFREVEIGLNEHTIQEECKRCLRCDLEWIETEEIEPVAQADRAPVEFMGEI